MRSGSIAIALLATSVVGLAGLAGAGCGAQIAGGAANNDDAADAGAPGDDAGAGAIDAGGAPGSDAMPPALQCTSRSVYLNFEGQALTRGRSDATTSTAEWMTIDSGTAPPYLAGIPGRSLAIQAIVDGVRAQLAGFPITVVTARPASGSYVMIVFGGRAGAVGSRFSGAVNRLDCDDSRPNDVAWVSDTMAPTQRVVNTAIGAIGFGLGLTATLDPKDCMCGWDNDCNDDDGAPCTLGSPIVRDPDANQRCAGAAATQDEVATLRKAFCM